MRTPIALGFIYLFIGWMAVVARIEQWGETGLGKSVVALQEFLGKPAVLAALVFIAYLVGCLALSILEPAATTLLIVVDMIRRRSHLVEYFWKYMTFSFMPPSAQRDLEALLISKLSRKGFPEVAYRREAWAYESSDRLLSSVTFHQLIEEAQREAGVTDELEEPLSEALRIILDDAWRSLHQERPYLKTKLMVENFELFGQYDRAMAESTFRVNVGFALGVLSVFLSFTVGPWWLVGLVAVSVLMQSGANRRSESNGVLVHALVNENLGSSALEFIGARWQEEIRAVIQSGQEPARSQQREGLDGAAGSRSIDESP
ncbi:hypothetical protein GCM10023335_81840 [Streptomyces siamensis]|uniref:DUF4239 domain-containing protein n=2 Tax=Streptomyces siamensis TaxID=1274986 RepID=A0ABP9JNK4_9ACTN